MESMVDQNAPPGLGYVPDFLSEAEENALIVELASFDWDGRGVFRRFGRTVRRREIHFLRDYGRNSRTVSGGTPLPDFLAPIRARVAAAVGIAPDAIGQVITAMYRPDAGIDWHTDSVKAFGETICGVSLGAPCRMQFRRGTRAPRWTMDLAPRSLLIMQGAARWEYQHHIPAVRDVRYSLTMRTLKDSDTAADPSSP